MEPLSIASNMRLGREVIALDLYAALGVSADARPDEIRKAYRRRVRESHPDLHPLDPNALSRTRELNLAFRVLLDPAARATYDSSRRDGRSRDASRSASRGASSSTPWWSRSSADVEYEWVAPPPTSPPSHPPEAARWLLGDLRGTAAHLLARFDSFLFALPPERRFALGSLSIGLALLLLAAASSRSSILGGDRPRPVSVSPMMLYP